MRTAMRCAVLSVAFLLLPLASQARDLTFDERVRIQEAIERVYHRHRIGTRRSFEQAVPPGLIESKVRDYLRRSATLRDRWGTDVTPRMLHAEMNRIARDTRMPGRLTELYAAVGYDPFLFQECVARPTLVSRLVSSFLAAEELDTVAEPDLRSFQAVASSSDSLPTPWAGDASAAEDSRCAAGDRWDNGALDDAPDGRSWHTTVWTGTEMLVWGGTSDAVDLASGYRYDPAIDSWRGISTANAPSPRNRHAAVWTGTEMVVWGGIGTADDLRSVYLDTGGRYDPLTDTWLRTIVPGAPTPRGHHSAVWTGGEMIVWGGYDLGGFLGDGGRYDPATDTWSAMDAAGPQARRDHTAIWTGSEMLVWGGYTFGFKVLGPGARYDPVDDEWRSMSSRNAPLSRASHTAVWSGEEMIVWGGRNSMRSFDSGARYDPKRNRWRTMTLTGAPEPRGDHAAVWTGSEMLVWGGLGEETLLVSGGRYDPSADAWDPLSSLGAPSARRFAGAVWDGSRMVVWGGFDADVPYPDSGGRYDPVLDVWTPTARTAAPPESEDHSAVWTGNHLIVWGGSDGAESDTGGRYDPLLDLWTPMTRIGAPSPRSLHTAVWSGDAMLVWGGGDPPSDTGAGYDPVADAWSDLPAAGAPSARARHTAVWTGAEMLIWGGSSPDGDLATGARYDPETAVWSPLGTSGAPQGRRDHTAVWTGREMIVWGGASSGSFPFTSGGRYDPSSDRWKPTRLAAAPSGRWDHTAVWTGREMIVWGGGFQGFDTGSRYNPDADRWRTMNADGAPEPRTRHGAVWTGSELVVWGGFRQESGSQRYYPATGGRYDPVTDHWTPIAIDGAPPGRHRLTLTFDGNHALAWGGSHGPVQGANRDFLRGGGRYVVDTDGDGQGNPCDDDDDDDGVPDGADCAPVRSDVWSIPGEVPLLLLRHDRSTGVTELGWNPPLEPGGTSPRYDVLRSTDPADFSAADCLVSDLPGSLTGDPRTPPAGGSFFHLVRAETPCGAGPLGMGSSGAPRIAPSCP